ncbi:MAG TPA: transposase [Verrucomicrobiota bacterium]|nr:transposase [Verrucomicrobiota bacterium]HOU88818.1 transposase [Verrucomicrobiota bacterium]
MFIAKVVSKGKHGKSYTSILLRESFRVGSSVKSKTLAVLTHLPPHVLEAVRRALAQPADSLAKLADTSQGSLRLRQGPSMGALWTIDQVAQRLGIKKALGVTWEAQLSYWQVLARLLRPGPSLLAMVRLAANSAAAALLGWKRSFTEDDLYANGAWLEGRHALIQRRLWHARPAPPKDQLFLYDVSSSYLEGDSNALAAWGYNRDHKEGKKQVVIGLLTDSQGEPVSIQVYRGNTNDLNTFGQQVHKIKKELGCTGVTLVGDRGMIRTDQKAACTADNTQAHALTAMLALKVRRHLEQAWRSLEVTVEEGLRQLEQLCVMELVHSGSGKVVARQVPEPSARQQQLLQALKLVLPATVPEAQVTVGTRKKINHVRKPLEK